MPSPTVAFMSTPMGSNIFQDWFSKEQVKTFAEKMMTPMPMIVSTGPKDKSHHWNSKDRGGSVIVTPEEPYRMRPLKEGEIVFDEYATFKENDWFKAHYEGSFSDIKFFEHSVGLATASATSATPGDWTEPLTKKTIEEAMEKVGMPVAKKRKIHKKAKPRGDPRRSKYSARQFGNILLSATKDIIGNTTLSDALFGTGLDNVLAETFKLIQPIFDDFFLTHGDKWQITGPMRLSAISIESGKWKSVSALGGEVLHFKEMEIGSRDGVCIVWESGTIVGMKDEMLINTTIKEYGDKIVQAQLEGNAANRPTLVDLLLDHAGKEDIVDAAREFRLKAERAIEKQEKEEYERKSEAYGEGFGSWA